MIVTTYPNNIPFELAVGEGKVTGYQNLYRSAYSNLVSTVRSVIRAGGGLYTFPPAATVMTLSSSSAADIGQLVLIEGLDANYVEQSDVLALNGQNGVTTKSYLRLNKITVITDSPNTVGGIYVGVGTITAGVPATVYGYCSSSDRVSQSTIFTVPAGKTYFVTDGSISSGTTAAGNKYVTAYFMSRLNNVLYTTSTINVTTSFQNLPYNPPIAIPEKTDIWTEAVSSSGTDSVAVTINGYLVTNGS